MKFFQFIAQQNLFSQTLVSLVLLPVLFFDLHHALDSFLLSPCTNTNPRDGDIASNFLNDEAIKSANAPNLDLLASLGLEKHVKRLNDSTAVITKLGIEIRFKCWASYPIDFVFSGHLVCLEFLPA